ncbi:uncharacterized protein LOC115051301 isoform X2 [Echeneis naucrates]|uniref:uncharacterized protein LOC115051301 isoform X2 n=1 Tax=Echeneis naucrates TaxID=173247 RepID=UPI0011137510|nr:uncharacterized protein LOC115051301 isoform X2 [Echeneis naucrates]
MLRLIIFCFVWFLQTFLISCHKNSTEWTAGIGPSPKVIRLSVPEDHQVCLCCGSSDPDHVFWTRQNRRVLTTRRGSYETNEDRQRYLLLSDGGLCVLQLEASDQGGYCCNDLLVAELQVLTGRDFTVAAGRTLLLPCGQSPKPKQRWFHRRNGERRELILTRFRNGTVSPEREGGRLSFRNDGLQIQDLQPEDAGEYHCNGELQATVSVLSVHPEPTSVQTSSSSSPTSTDVVEVKKKEKKKSENALLLVAVVGLGLMILFMLSVCVLLSSLKLCRRNKHRYEARRQEDTELQPWTPSYRPDEPRKTPSPPEDNIHYASLGHQNWRDRPSRTPAEQDQHHVIYSVITRPVAQKTPN